MSNKVLLVTSPDDVSIDALRILLVGLNDDQSSIISDALTNLEQVPETVVYVANETESAAWLIDKKQKSKLIIFNAEMDNGELVGYLAAQPNAYFFGNMRYIGITTKRALFDRHQAEELLKEKITEHERS
jgi:hypothetical protein